jgi:SAM-dependent methyltransferase
MSNPRTSATAAPDFVSLTEISGDDVAAEQVERLARRYYWVGGHCAGKDVLEVACGAGQGLGYLQSIAKSVTAGDYTPALLDLARRHYGERVRLEHFDAQQMPFAAAAFDVVLILEALYYIPDLDRFFAECRRVLRPGGRLLIATANKDLFDFTPSPNSHRYLGVVELGTELARHGFTSAFFGDTPVAEVSARQRVLRPIKAAASKLGLIPSSMNGKKLLKRLFFGGLVKRPAEIGSDTAPKVAPAPLPGGRPDRNHKVVFCAATLGA